MDKLFRAEIDTWSIQRPQGVLKQHYIWFYVESNSTPIGYIHLINRPHSNEIELSSIEVKDEYRGRGYSKDIIKSSQRIFDMNIVHFGPYTSLGLERVAHLFNDTQYPKSEVIIHKSFVESWSDKKASVNYIGFRSSQKDLVFLNY